VNPNRTAGVHQATVPSHRWSSRDRTTSSGGVSGCSPSYELVGCSYRSSSSSLATLVLVPERFLASHIAEGNLGIGAAVENLRLYRRALELVSEEKKKEWPTMALNWLLANGDDDPNGDDFFSSRYTPMREEKKTDGTPKKSAPELRKGVTHLRGVRSGSPAGEWPGYPLLQHGLQSKGLPATAVVSRHTWPRCTGTHGRREGR